MKYALVTGGSRGIGRAIAVKLASDGYHVLVNYVSNDVEAQKTLESIHITGGEGELLRFDVGNRVQVQQCIEDWQTRHPGEYIEVLVNNAGIRKDNLLIWMEDQEWDRVLNIGLDGFYNVTKPLIKDMLIHRLGRIINMASLSGLEGLPGQCNYSAAKGGLISLTKALAKEVGRKGVTVNAVAPGFIRTDMVEGLDESTLKKTIPMNRFGEPEEVAELVSFLCSKNAGYISGECISINGGM